MIMKTLILIITIIIIITGWYGSLNGTIVMIIIMIIIMDVQTYPKRFLPELNKTQ